MLFKYHIAVINIHFDAHTVFNSSWRTHKDSEQFVMDVVSSEAKGSIYLLKTVTS